jgi:hypothetical protein
MKSMRASLHSPLQAYQLIMALQTAMPIVNGNTIKYLPRQLNAPKLAVGVYQSGSNS